MTTWVTVFVVSLAVKSPPRIFFEGILVFTLALLAIILIASLIVLSKLTLSRNIAAFGKEWNRSPASRRWLFDQMFAVIEIIGAALFAVPITWVALGELSYPLNVILLLSCIVIAIVMRDGIRRFLKESPDGNTERSD
ncbi:MAG: hypothetical protein ACKVT0_11845 [Planctomycetaceae bacterium]